MTTLPLCPTCRRAMEDTTTLVVQVDGPVLVHRAECEACNHEHFYDEPARRAGSGLPLSQ